MVGQGGVNVAVQDRRVNRGNQWESAKRLLWERSAAEAALRVSEANNRCLHREGVPGTPCQNLRDASIASHKGAGEAFKARRHSRMGNLALTLLALL